MLKVKVKKTKDFFSKIDLLGHADYDDFGKDIVCAAASSILITTVNAILSFDKTYITYENKKDHFMIKVNKNNEIVDNLLKNMMNMFDNLKEDYPENIKIEEE